MSALIARPRAVSLAAALATCLLAPAWAEVPGQDWKGYTGLSCLSQNPSDNLRRSAVNHPAIANQGAGQTTVYCPVVRDESAGGPNRVAAVAVRVVNRHPTLALRCDFASHDQTGAKVDAKTASVPQGEHTLQLGPVNAHNWGSYSLLCQLPGVPAGGLPSYIVNYRVDETVAP